MKKFENTFLCLLIAFSGTMYIACSQAPSYLEEPITAANYGSFVSVLCGAACVFRLIFNLFMQTKITNNVFVIRELKLVVAQIILTIFYTLGITNIGYFTTTFLYLNVSLIILSGRKTPKYIVMFLAFTLLFCVGLYGAFKVFQVFLPNSPLI
jgi:hypothetical protein